MKRKWKQQKEKKETQIGRHEDLNFKAKKRKDSKKERMKQTERQTEQRDTMIKNTQGNQFDQMAELSFRFWAINSNENLPY